MTTIEMMNLFLSRAQAYALASIAESLAKLASTVSNYEDAAIRARQG